MNIEDLEYALAAAEINESITEKKINELEEKRLQKFALKGQEIQKNPKTDEQIELEKEKEKYTIEKNNILNLINSYNSLKKTLDNTESKYSKYTLEDFENLKKEKEEELKKIKNRIEELEKARIPAFKLKDAETKLRDKTQEQIDLENSISSIESDIQKLTNIVLYANRVKQKISLLDDSDMTKYARNYQEIIYEAKKANLPTTVILNLMRNGLSSEFTQNGEKLTTEAKNSLRDKINNNLENIRNRKLEDEKRINDMKIDAGIQNAAPQEKVIQNESNDNITTNETIETDNNEPIFKDETRIDKNHSWMDAQNAQNLGYSSEENMNTEKTLEEKDIEKLQKMSIEELKRGLSILEKTKQHLDEKIVEIDLNAPWKNTYEDMGKYIRVMKKIKLCNDELARRKELEESETKNEENQKTNSGDKEAREKLDDKVIDIKDILKNSKNFKIQKLEQFKKAKQNFDLGSNFKKVKDKLIKKVPNFKNKNEEENNLNEGGKTL